jgi:Response regulator of the LytR/AlgR family
MNRYIYFNSRDEFFRIHLSQIIYFAADKNYTLMQLQNGQKLIFTFSLQKMQEYLAEKLQEDAKHFARIGKSYIINLNYVYQIDTAKQQLKLLSISNQKEFRLLVSKDALKNLRKLFINK